MAFGSLNLCRFHWETQNLYQGIVWQWRCEVSPKQLLYSLSWIVPLVGGILSLIVIWFARQSSRASNQYIPAFMLNAIGIILVGLGSLFLNYEYNWTSVVFMVLAALCIICGNILIYRHLPR